MACGSTGRGPYGFTDGANDSFFSAVPATVFSHFQECVGNLDNLGAPQRKFAGMPPHHPRKSPSKNDNFFEWRAAGSVCTPGVPSCERPVFSTIASHFGFSLEAHAPPAFRSEWASKNPDQSREIVWPGFSGTCASRPSKCPCGAARCVERARPPIIHSLELLLDGVLINRVRMLDRC